jgi:hypothetical protein
MGGGDESDDNDAPTKECDDCTGNEFGCNAHNNKKVTIATTTPVAFPTPRTIRHVMMAMSTPRTVNPRMVMRLHQKSQDNEGSMELDTHANTGVACSKMVALNLTGKVVSVSPFRKSEFKIVAHRDCCNSL